MQFESWLAFCSIALLATATPGPAALLVSTNSIITGFKGALLTICGNITGLLIMSAFSVLGLSAVVLHSAIAFTIIKVLGALYLVYIGVNLWRKGINTLNIEKPVKSKKRAISLYFQGILVALTNPKAIIFTTALFPQFIVITEPLFPQFTLLVISFMSLSFLCLTAYSLLTQRAKKGAVRVVPSRIIGKIFGSTFICAGCFLATVQK